jgi:sister chromatid cohesion protein DCC1
VKSTPSTSETAPAQAILCTPGATYRIQQKNSSNPIMILEPTLSKEDDQNLGIPVAALKTIAKIEDTLELSKQEGDAAPAAPAKVNKWHEKFAKGRAAGKGKG